ncbi:MAG: PAS domain-containing protein [Proteobacteria bacterium]|nr:PAS domain-containing protein [Pseudomonadota bacterium]
MDAPAPPAAPFPHDRDWKIAALWDYWAGVWGRCGRMPRRADIDPIDIPKLLPNLWIVDYDRPGARFRYRLIGTAVTRAWDGDITGRYLDQEIPDLAKSALGRELTNVVTEGLPVWRRAEPSWTPAPQDVVKIERLALPLAAGDGTVAMVLCVSVYRRRNGEMF